MPEFDDRLRATLRSVDGQNLVDPNLEQQVLAGVRRQRLKAHGLRALGVFAVSGTAVAIWAYLPGGNEESTADDPSIFAEQPTGVDCSGVRATSAGISSLPAVDGGREVALVFVNHGPEGTACVFDSKVSIALTDGMLEASANAPNEPVVVPADADPTSATIVTLIWRNWCSTAPVSVKASFGDGSMVDRRLGAEIALPTCNDAGAGAILEVSEVIPGAETIGPSEADPLD